jgi:hypothetical protein
MFFSGMDKNLKSYLKLIVKPQIEATTYYGQSSKYKNLMREQWLSNPDVSCYIFALIFIPIQKSQLSNPTKQYCNAYDYLFGKGARDLLQEANIKWNSPDFKDVADKMFDKAKRSVSIITSQLQSGEVPNFGIIQQMIDDNPLQKEIDSLASTL